MTVLNWVYKSSSNDLLPDGTKPLPEPMFTYHQRGPVTITWGQFLERYLSHHLLQLAWKLLFKIAVKSPKCQWVNMKNGEVIGPLSWHVSEFPELRRKVKNNESNIVKIKHMRQWIGPALVQIRLVAYSAPSHYLTQCWVIAGTVLIDESWRFLATILVYACFFGIDIYPPIRIDVLISDNPRKIHQDLAPLRFMEARAEIDKINTHGAE